MLAELASDSDAAINELVRMIDVVPAGVARESLLVLFAEEWSVADRSRIRQRVRPALMRLVMTVLREANSGSAERYAALQVLWMLDPDEFMRVLPKIGPAISDTQCLAVSVLNAASYARERQLSRRERTALQTLATREMVTGESPRLPTAAEATASAEVTELQAVCSWLARGPIRVAPSDEAIADAAAAITETLESDWTLKHGFYDDLTDFAKSTKRDLADREIFEIRRHRWFETIAPKIESEIAARVRRLERQIVLSLAEYSRLENEDVRYFSLDPERRLSPFEYDLHAYGFALRKISEGARFGSLEMLRAVATRLAYNALGPASVLVKACRNMAGPRIDAALRAVELSVRAYPWPRGTPIVDVAVPDELRDVQVLCPGPLLDLVFDAIVKNIHAYGFSGPNAGDSDQVAIVGRRSSSDGRRVRIEVTNSNSRILSQRVSDNTSWLTDELGQFGGVWEAPRQVSSGVTQTIEVALWDR